MSTVKRDANGVPEEWTLLHAGVNRLVKNGKDYELHLSEEDLDAISSRMEPQEANRNTAVMKQRAAQTELDEAKAELDAARREFVKAFPEEETDEERDRRVAEATHIKRETNRRIPWNTQDTINTVNELAQQYPVIPIHAVTTFELLPDAVKQDAARRGINKAGARAVWHNGEVYVLADKTRPSDVEKRILHEVVGHEGLRRVFGEDFDRFLNDVYQLHSADIEKMGLSALYNTSPDTEAGQRYLAEEYLARLAEQDVKPSWWRDLLSKIKAYLRKALPGNHFSDADIEAALMRSARVVRRKAKAERAASSASGRGNARFALVGKDGAYTSDAARNSYNLMRAKEMEAAGEEAKSIWMATGWERGADGMWRMEVPDLSIKTDELTRDGNYNALIEYEGPLDGYVNAPEIFDAYPELKNAKVRILPLPRGTAGFYNSDSGTVVINRTILTQQGFDALNDMAADMKEAKTPREAKIIQANIQEELEIFAEGIRNTLIHEVQHAIQHIEGFATGTSPEAAFHTPDAFDPAYQRAAERSKELDEQYSKLWDKILRLDEKWGDNPVFRDAMNDYYLRNRDDNALEPIRKEFAGNPDLDRYFDLLNQDKELERKRFAAHAEQAELGGARSRYRRYAGEVEARNAEQRAVMSDERRRETMPSETEDVPRENQIVRFSIEERNQSLEGVNDETFQQDLERVVDEKVKQGYYRLKNEDDKEKIVNGALEFYRKYAKKEIPLSDGRIVYFMPDKRSIERGGNTQAWEEYCIHAVTSSGKKIEGEDFAERLYNHTKNENLDRIEDIIREENVFAKIEDKKPENDAVIFVGETNEGKRLEIITRLDKYGNINADLTEVTFLAKNKQKNNPPHVPLTEAVQTVARHQGAGYSPSTDSNIASSGKKSSSITEKAANFKRWFKDSKVVDEDGKPLVVYHGTDADFNALDMDKTRANMDIRGAFFSPWDDDARGYGKNVRAFYLSIQNPATGDQAYKALNMFKGQNNAGVKARDYLIQQGYDGVINENEEYIAFYPEQIKSVDNVGTFDPNNPDVRYSLDNMSEEDKSDLVKLLKPKWTEEAFVEPGEVKAYLESLGETGIDENEAWSLWHLAGKEVAAQKQAAARRARDKWIEENYDLIRKVSEFSSTRGLLDFVIRPSFRFKDNDEWPGTFIAEAWRKKGKKPKQFARESDLHYRERLRKRDEALEHADGKASDELAQEIANKYGGDPLDIEEQIISTFRYLKKPDLYSAYSKFLSDQNYRTKQENEIAEAEYAEYKREQIEQTVADMLENGKQITEEWAMANPEVFAELYRQLMHSEPPKSKKPSRENLEAMNAALANKDINAETYKAAKRAAIAEYQKRLTALRQEMNDKNANAAKLQRDAAAFAEEHLPEELRGKFTRGIINLLNFGTSPSKNYPEGKRMAEFYKLQSAMLNAAQSKRTQDSIGHINEMLDAVKVKRNWKGIPVSVIPSEQARVERIRKIVDMNAASVANAIDYNNERILELEDKSDKDFEDGKTSTEAVLEIQKLKDDNALLELFGNLAYRKPDSVTKAEEFLESLIRGGKAKFKSLLAEQAGRVMEMRQQAVNQITGGRNVIPRHGTDAKNHTPYMTKNMNLPTLLRLIAARAGIEFDSTVFGKLLRNVEDSTQKEATANRRLQEDFDAELEAECGITGTMPEKIRKKGRFIKDAGKVVEHTGVFKTQYSRLKSIDPFDNPIVQEDRSSSRVHLIPVEDYKYKGETKPGVRSILRTIDNGGSVEFDGVPLDETGIWMLRKQLNDYDAGIDRRLDFFVDEIDKESAEKLKEDSEKDKLAVISRGKNVEEKRVEVPLSQGTALQVLLTWEQEDYRANMKWNGWTEESIEQIKRFLKPETLKLGYWMRDYFAKQRGELDAAAVKRYGAHLPENANYWPGRFSGRGGTIGTGGMRGVGTMSINPSFLIARKFHLNPVDIDVDAFSVFMDGQAEQNHFLAWTDTIRDLREVVGNADVQDAINGYFGTEVTRNLTERIVTMAQNGTQRGFLVSFFNPMMRHFIPAKIAMNVGSIMKQTEGVLAYMNKMPAGEFFKYMSRANFNDPDYRAFAEMAVKSDYLKNRMAGGLDRDILYLMQYTRDVAHYSPFGDSLVSATTYLNKRADRWSALHGGFAIYQYTLDQARKSGLDEKTAQERARRAWMRATDETQQSGYLKDLNYFQHNQGLVRYLTAFMSNPIQVMNLELQTLNEIKYIPDNAEAKRKLARQIVVNHLIVPTLMRFTTDMMRYGINLSDWWDDAEFEDYFQAWLLGPFEGLFFFGKVAGAAWDLAEYVLFGRRGKELHNADVNALPLLGETRQNAMRFRKDVLDGELTQKDVADALSFAGDIGMLYGATPFPGAAEAGSAGVVANASGTLWKRFLRMFRGDEDKKKSRK